MIVVVTQNEIVPDWYTKYKMASEVSIRDARIFRAIEDGPSFLKDDVEQILLPRDHLLNEVKTLIMPEQRIWGYSLIIGEHGTGKTSLVRLAISEIKKPKGIAYVLIPHNPIEDTAIVQAVKESLNWMPNLVDSQNGK